MDSLSEFSLPIVMGATLSLRIGLNPGHEKLNQKLRGEPNYEVGMGKKPRTIGALEGRDDWIDPILRKCIAQISRPRIGKRTLTKGKSKVISKEGVQIRGVMKKQNTGSGGCPKTAIRPQWA